MLEYEPELSRAVQFYSVSPLILLYHLSILEVSRKKAGVLTSRSLIWSSWGVTAAPHLEVNFASSAGFPPPKAGRDSPAWGRGKVEVPRLL